ncbi:hypothetical protein TVAG_003720 [Trichomonas vaginalis G3]|uniref:Transcription and mRNA export factor ENY2 n=1 Tax=Trichomonas vaginalis (strain ATCC PRA-98 / G3) TaxID=412133 RepID=A2E586_TRIV3|nr:transcription factor e(y)2 family [Trichomonas vaginalis G3]EAY12166.1 hypothetical protein TVAG_003720 [Trichomonas vaginalis G3]KAI5515387.1 transcription factor e(y)2 family [Trichomonas vaginalis G3]|eukprot:XP_001324389.1 hypothetical protein [Trichomonas vaginalis G3]
MSNNNNNFKNHEEKVKFYRDKILKQLEADGDIDKVRNSIKELVGKSNWREEVKSLSLKVMSNETIEDLTPEIVAEKIREQAISSLPKNLKANTINHIKDTLVKKQVPIENPAE